MKVTDNLALGAYDTLRKYCKAHPYPCIDCVFADEHKGCLMDGHLVNSLPQDWPEVEVVE